MVVLALAVAALVGFGRVAEPPPDAKIATCDVYSIMRELVDSEEFKPGRGPLEEKLRGFAPELREMESTLRDMEAMLRGSDPKEEAAQAKYKEFVAKRQEFAGKRQEFEKTKGELDQLMGRQFVQAYERVKVAADAVAIRRGYTHIVASRDIDQPPTNDPDRITQALLSRPMLYSPEADDVTKDVLKELNLGEKK